jgi:hypothetical protein
VKAKHVASTKLPRGVFLGESSATAIAHSSPSRPIVISIAPDPFIACAAFRITF